MTYRDAAALSANYARVFTPEVKAAVASAKADDLFARDQKRPIGIVSLADLIAAKAPLRAKQVKGNALGQKPHRSHSAQRMRRGRRAAAA